MRARPQTSRTRTRSPTPLPRSALLTARAIACRRRSELRAVASLPNLPKLKVGVGFGREPTRIDAPEEEELEDSDDDDL